MLSLHSLFPLNCTDWSFKKMPLFKSAILYDTLRSNVWIISCKPIALVIPHSTLDIESGYSLPWDIKQLSSVNHQVRTEASEFLRFLNQSKINKQLTIRTRWLFVLFNKFSPCYTTSFNYTGDQYVLFAPYEATLAQNSYILRNS